MAEESQIVTFYSYKGGTGRTMTLANVAWILASNGKRVLAVDWDLEAPGLHRYFHPFLLDKECKSSPGVIDMVWDVSVSATKPVGRTPDPGWYQEHADVLKYAVSLRWEFSNGGTLDVLPAGRQGSAYATRVNSFNWKNFYERFGGGGFLDAVVASMRRHYQYVLIDSRTGVSDTSGICTVQLPDTLVVCFTLNTQSIEGAAAVTRSVVDERADRPLRVFPVPMRLEDGEKKKLDAGLDFAYKRFAPFVSTEKEQLDKYWGEVAVPYKRFYAYEEVLAPFADRAKQAQALLPTAERLTSYITDGSVTAAVPIPEPERRRWLAQFERVADNDDSPLQLGMAAMRDGNLEVAGHYLLQAVQDGEESGDADLLADASLQLSALTRKQGDAQAAEAWYRKAFGDSAGQSPEAIEKEASELIDRRIRDLLQRLGDYRMVHALSAILDRRAIVAQAYSIADDSARLQADARRLSLRPAVQFDIERSLREVTPESLTAPFRRAAFVYLAAAGISLVVALVLVSLGLTASVYGFDTGQLVAAAVFAYLALFIAIPGIFALRFQARTRHEITNILENRERVKEAVPAQPQGEAATP